MTENAGVMMRESHYSISCKLLYPSDHRRRLPLVSETKSVEPLPSLSITANATEEGSCGSNVEQALHGRGLAIGSGPGQRRGEGNKRRAEGWVERVGLHAYGLMTMCWASVRVIAEIEACAPGTDRDS